MSHYFSSIFDYDDCDKNWLRRIWDIQGWAKEMTLSWEKVSARLQPATAGHARLVLSKTVLFFCPALYLLPSEWLSYCSWCCTEPNYWRRVARSLVYFSQPLIMTAVFLAASSSLSMTLAQKNVLCPSGQLLLILAHFQLKYNSRAAFKNYRVIHLLWNLGWVHFDLGVTLSCPAALSLLPNSHQPKQNWANSVKSKS